MTLQIENQTKEAGGPPSAVARPLLTSVTLHAPLIGIESARLALRCGEDDIMEWILSGELEWAFDLRRAGASRACCRVLTESVIRKQERAGRLSARARTFQRRHGFHEIFEGLFPHRRPVLLSGDLSRIWNCSASHLHNLMQDGLLVRVEKNYARREVFQFPRENVRAFMESRRMK